MSFCFPSSLSKIETVVHDSGNMLRPVMALQGHSDEQAVREQEVSSLQEQDQPPSEPKYSSQAKIN